MTEFDTSFDLRLLRSLAAVAEELHFSATGDILHCADRAVEAVPFEPPARFEFGVAWRGDDTREAVLRLVRWMSSVPGR